MKRVALSYCILIACIFVSSIQSQTYKKRAPPEETDSLYDLHHATITRTSTAMTATYTKQPTETAQPTSAPATSSNSPQVIPSNSTEWQGKPILCIQYANYINKLITSFI